MSNFLTHLVAKGRGALQDLPPRPPAPFEGAAPSPSPDNVGGNPMAGWASETEFETPAAGPAPPSNDSRQGTVVEAPTTDEATGYTHVSEYPVKPKDSRGRQETTDFDASAQSTTTEASSGILLGPMSKSVVPDAQRSAKMQREPMTEVAGPRQHTATTSPLATVVPLSTPQPEQTPLETPPSAAEAATHSAPPSQLAKGSPVEMSTHSSIPGKEDQGPNEIPPAPLLPPDPPPSRPKPDAVRHHDTKVGKTTEPPLIEVQIGSIEVVNDTPQQLTQPAPVRERGLSLDEFLDGSQ